ncbi:MAG: efflux RND transporter periplasmic adaptor subunit [Magnetococcus sp. YQC-5]
MKLDLSWLAVALGVICCLPSTVTPAPPVSKEEKAVLSVTTTHLQHEVWPHTLLANGGIFPWQEALVASEIGGLAITSLLVDVGSVVRQGQELVRLNDATVKAALLAQQANVTRAKAALALATANANRARGVKGTSAFSEQKSTEYLLGEASAQAQLAAAQAALEMEEVHLRQTRILAADDGVIASRTATLGSVVQVGSELFRMVRQGRLEWRAELTAYQLTRIKPDLHARLTLSNGQTTQATLRQIAPTQDPTTRKGLVYFDLPKEAPVQAGLFAQGEIQLGMLEALTLPQSAIVLNDGFSYVFEVLAQEHVTRHKVTTGRQQDKRIEILSGLTEQASVVVSGGDFLKDGDRVKVLTTGGTP